MTRERIRPKKPRHPGKTKGQRRALDAIGCGDHSPPMQQRTLQALLNDGLIVARGVRRIGSGPLAVVVTEYEMPIHVHIAWCAHQAGAYEK